MAIVIKKFEPTEQTKRIIQLAEEAQEGVEITRLNMRTNIEIAMKCGALLIKEQNHVTKQMGRGFWSSYFEINFSKILPLRSAQRWMGLARAHGAGARSLSSKTSAGVLPGSSGGDDSLRSGILALGIFPVKTPAEVAGNRTTPTFTSHLAVVNRFKKWHAAMRKRRDYEPMTQTQREQLRKDFREVHEFCQEIFAP